jgi:hypothetical protein
VAPLPEVLPPEELELVELLELAQQQVLVLELEAR